MELGPPRRLRPQAGQPIGKRAAALRSRGLAPTNEKVALLLEFAADLRVGEGEMVGKPLQLMPWQVDWLNRTFAPGVRRSILSVARRNGKTALVAVLVLAALFGPISTPNSLILSASRSREQASLVFTYCRKMLQVSGLVHLVHIRDSAKEIACPRLGTLYRAISADATTAVGFGARLVIHDELGQVRGPRDSLFEALSSGMGSYANSLELLISTQAPTDADLFSNLLDDALGGWDKSVVGVLYAAPKDCDLMDEAAWRSANPSMQYGVRDAEDLARKAAEAQRLPSQENGFRNYMLNQRVATHSPFLTPAVWDSCAGPVSDEAFRMGRVHGGLDLSSRQDLTALMLAVEDADGVVHLRTHAWTPEATIRERGARDRAPYDAWRQAGHLEAMPGVAIDLEVVAFRLADLCRGMDVERIMFDRWRMPELRRWLEKIEAWHVLEVLAEHGQGYKDMTLAVDVMSQKALEGKIRHGGQPVLRWCMSNVVITSDPANNRKPDKAKAFGRIDCVVAAMMAIRSACGDPSKPAMGADQLLFV